MPYLGKQPARVPVTAADIPDDSITAAKILDGVITAEDIGDDAVGVAELSATGTASSSTFLRGDNAWATPSVASTATASATGVIKIEDDTDQSVAANTVSTTAGRTYGLQLNSSDQGVVNVPWTDTNTTYSVGDGGLTTNDFTNTDHTKLNGIEASADVTDATNVTAAGALMDSEVTNLAEVKAFDASDYATAAQGTTADAALPKAGGTMTGNLALGDDDLLRLGDSNDLQMYHDGSHSYIDEQGTGDLYIRSNSIILGKYTGETMVQGNADGSVDLYHNNSKKFETTAAGATVTGTLTATLQANAIDSDHYVDGSIDAAHLSSSLGDLGAKGITDIGHNAGDKITFTDNTDMRFTVNANEEMRLEADGDLHVDGDVIAFSTTISDATLKYNINPVEFALDKIKQLKGVTFNYLKGNKASAGLLAQDVEKVMPSAVTERKLPLHSGNDKSYKTLHYDSMTAILVEAIKELTAKVEKLEKR